MAPKLYTVAGSPYCRAVHITAKAIGLNLDHHEVDFDNNEHLSPAFLKINPQHTVPTLDDNGDIIWDSHAIITYLAGKYSKDDSLYPKDLYKRALVDQKLHFESGILSANLISIEDALITKEIKDATPKMVAAAKQVYDFLEKFLEGKQWVALDRITLADISIYPSLLSLDVVVKIEPKAYPNIMSWIKRIQALPWLQGDEKEQKAFVDFIQSLK